MQTALVFAGHSFLGQALCTVLRKRGAHVVATARGNPLPPETVPCDLTCHAEVESVIERERPEVVIQCAGATRTSDAKQMYDLHLGGTLAVLTAVARYTPSATVILLGSAAEYGPVAAENLPISEGCPEAPTTPFGASKLAQTHLARAAAAQWGLRVLTVRPFNVIGRGLPDHYFAASLGRRLLQLRSTSDPCPFPVVNPHATRDFVDVRDVAEALTCLTTQAAITAGKMEIYNIATGVETSLLELARELGTLAGGFVPVDGGCGDSRGGVMRSRGDSMRLRSVTGSAPRRTWQESVRDLWESLQR